MPIGSATHDPDHSPSVLAGRLSVRRLRVMRGPSLLSLSPVIAAELLVDQLAALGQRERASVARRVEELLGVSAPHEDHPGAEWWGALLVAVTTELQRRAGWHEASGWVAPTGATETMCSVVICYDEEELAEEALREGARILRDCLREDDPEIDDTVRELARGYQRARPDPTALAVMREARRRGIPVRRDPGDGAILLGLGATTHRLEASTTDHANILADEAPSNADRGTPRHEPGELLDLLYPAGTPSTIPVIAVTGTNGKTTTTRLIAHLFREAGRVVGFTTTDGVYVQEDLLMEGDLTGPFAASIVLAHATVEVAVLETARGGILRAGLGFETCDVAVVTNVTADHLGLRGIDTLEQLAEVKALIPSVVKDGGHTVLNADDPLVLAMQARTKGRVVLFSMQGSDSPAVSAHLEAGGTALLVEPGDGGEQIVARDGERRIVIDRVADLPLTFGGLARFQVENVLAAVAAAHAQGLPVEQIREGLRTFVPSATMTPGRLNVVDTTRGRIILDYAHNVAAIRGVLEFLASSSAGRRLALIGAPGDRRDEDLRAIGALATVVDHAVFKEHAHYRRGRAAGETAGMMREGFLAAGGQPERVRAFAEEHEAIDYALGVMQQGDVAVVIADDMGAVMEQLRPHLLHAPA